MAENKYLLDMECNSCGASISLDVDNLIAFCPYCGNKLMVDPIAFRDLLVEREKTKRLEMQFNHEKEMVDAVSSRKSAKNKSLIIAAAIGLILLVAGIAVGETNIGTALTIGGIFVLLGVTWVWALAVVNERNKEKHQRRQELFDQLKKRR